VTFIFVTGDKGPFVGELKVSDLVYDSPEAFCGVLGFLYRLRAKATHVEFELMDDLDLGTLIPDCEQAERTVGGHVMARLLDVPGVLQKMLHPAGAGTYVVGVEDAFMPENSGCYRVTFGTGKAIAVEMTDREPDLSVTEETLCQLVVGRIDLNDARYRAGTVIHGNEEILAQVFVRRPVCLDL
jgi:predicted acetyltransferase